MLSVWAPNIYDRPSTKTETERRYRRFTLTHESYKMKKKDNLKGIMTFLAT